MRINHEIFQTPNQVELSISDRPTPESYRLYPEGADVNETLPMWRVQTEGFLEDKGMLIGVVADNLDDGPDGEFIAGGTNSKGPDSMAIGRQGPYFHWGFAASPTYMTDEAKLVFVNAIHYIKKFEGQYAFEETKAVTSRSSIEFMNYQLSEKGSAVWKANAAESAKQDEKRKQEIRERLEAGEEISLFEKSFLDSPARIWNRRDALRRVPTDLREEYGDNFDSYMQYYRENLPYFYSDIEQRYGPLILDKDAKSLGIPIDDLRLLERCIGLLESDSEHVFALTLLKRYTRESWSSAEDWKTWLNQFRDYLVFSESSGYKFIVDLNRLNADGKAHLLKTDSFDFDSLQKAIEELEVDAPADDHPVAFDGVLVPVDSDNEQSDRLQFNVIVKFKIRDGWHLYSDVPPGQPYIPTSIRLKEVVGVQAVGEWDKTVGTPSLENPQLIVWEGECVFSGRVEINQDVAVDTSLELAIDYQVCNEATCLPVQSKTLKLKISNPTKSASSLKYQSGIQSIFQDSHGNYWFGSLQEGVCLFDGESFTYFTIEKGLSSNQVRTIQEDEDGRIWFGTANGVCNYDGVKITSLGHEEIGDLQGEWMKSDKDLWFSAGNHEGVYRYDGQRLNYLAFPKPQNTNSDNVYFVTSLAEGKNDMRWIGTYAGVYGYDGRSLKVINDEALGYDKKGDYLHVRSILEDSKGRLWIGNNGIGVLLHTNESTTNFSEQMGLIHPNSLGMGDASDTGTLEHVFAIEEDRRGNVWFGDRDTGIWKYNGREVVNYSEKDGLSDIFAQTIYRDKEDELWFGFSNGEIYTFNGESFEKRFGDDPT